MVPVVDLKRRMCRHRAELEDAVGRVVESGHLLLGPETEAFEAELAAWSGHRHAVAVSSGAAALQLTMAALGIGPGDEVIVPALTAVPTASAVCAVGATPVFADVHDTSATVDPVSVTAATTPATAAVVPVHLYGHPAVLPDTTVPVVEDAAQAHGAVTGPRSSAAVAYSFYPTKNLGGIGDGGAVCTDDADIAARLRTLRVHGMTKQYVHVAVAQNFRMSEIEAAWLRVALSTLAIDNERRRTIAAHYRQSAPHLTWQAAHDRHVYHLCVFRHPGRDAAIEQLHSAGVATAVHYPLAMTQQPAYRQFVRQACPHAESWARECITVPCYPDLTDREVEHVAAALSALSGEGRPA